MVAIRSGSTVREAARLAVASSPTACRRWLLVDQEALVGRVVREPHRDEIQAPVDEQLIVEFYSRV